MSLRKDRGLTQAHVATHMGLAGSTWSRIENGLSALSIEQLVRVTRQLDVRPSDIFVRADEIAETAAKEGVCMLDAPSDNYVFMDSDAILGME